MPTHRSLYTWFYDNIHCRYYDILVRWCFLALGGEDKVRRSLIDAVGPRKGDSVLDMCCGTGGATFIIAQEVGEHSEVKGIDVCSGQVTIA